MASGIYIILNTVNDSCYVGQAVNFKNRWNGHKYDLRRGKHHSIHLQRAWTKYGETSFEFHILDEVAPEILTEREQHWMDYLRFIGAKMYNTSPAAGSNRGIKQSPEWVEKRIAKSRGRKASPELLAKLSAAKIGVPQSAKQIEGNKKRSSRMLGMKWSQKALEKRSESRKGYKPSAEAKAKMVANHVGTKGMKFSQESIAKRKATKERNRLEKLKKEKS